MKEIESALKAFPGVRDAVLVKRDNGCGNSSVVACLVADAGSTVPPEEIQRYLQGRFPNGPLPEDILIAFEPPRAADGTLDTGKLTGSRLTPVASTGKSRDSLTLVEDIVAAVCCSVLRCDRLGLGEAISGAASPAKLTQELVSRLSETFQVELSSNDVAHRRTVPDLAQLVEVAIRKASGYSIPPPRQDQPAEIPPLSSLQQRIWFFNRLQPENSSYHLSAMNRLRGALDVQALERSLSEIARNHPELRTRFPGVDGLPSRNVSSRDEIVVVQLDLRNLPESQREEEGVRLAEEVANREFDLSRDLGWRVGLIRLTDTDHLLVIALHKIVADRRSLNLLLAELQSLYRCFVDGGDPRLSPEPVTYANYAGWEQQWFHRAAFDQQLAFWKQQLQDAIARLELPLDRPRPTGPVPCGGSRSSSLGQPLLQRLHQLSRQEGATLGMTLMASFQALLHRYTGADDVLVGMPVSRRTAPELENVIGPLTDVIVLRGRLGDRPTFRELLRRTRVATCEACWRQDLPFARLVEELHPDRNLSQTPVFQVMFEQVFEECPDLELSGINCSPVTAGPKPVNLDLKLTVIQGEPVFRVVLEYRPDLFDESTIQRLLDCWQTLLESAAANPDQRISELCVLPESERRQLLEEWNRTAVKHPDASCFTQLFEAGVESHPDSLAVVSENQELTYRELNTRANQLARHLRTLGVGPDVLVALSVERSLHMAVGLLGILKAGGAYVPLDPEYPKERLDFILKDSAPAVVVTQKHLKPALPPTTAHIVLLDGDREALETLNPGNLETGLPLEHLAYVIYTSGSTGSPKGVLVSHGNLMNLSYAVVRRYGLRPSDHVLQFSTLNFDIAVEEIFPTWLCGATLVLRGDKAPPALPQFLRLIARRRLTVLNIPTAFWHELVHHLAESGAELPSSLRLVVVGGEQASASVYAKWRELVDDRIGFLNSYGPTETTVTATVYEAPRYGSVEAVPTPLPIGRPLDNTQVLVLDSGLRPVPIGVAGELHLGGAGVARGYLNRPDLTAEKFIPHPGCVDPRNRLYKTGDRVRYLPDGNLQFLGRIDQQVKIRGFRIEPGEIETVLEQHSEVTQAAVKVWECSPGDKQLVGYVVLRPESDTVSATLRAYLKSRLPAHLVPAHFVALPAFPLSPNGKVNHQALPYPSQEVGSEAELTSARDRLEFQLVEIWREVLGLSRVGIRDSFFELGGHSLMAVRMFSRIEKIIGKPLPLATLFQAPSVEQLADILRNEGWQPSKSSLVAIQPRGTKRPFFCVHGGGGGVLWQSDLARHMGANQPIYGLQSPGFDAEREPLDSIVEMARLYLEEIRAVQPNGPYLLGGFSMGGAIAYEMAQQLLKNGEQVAFLALVDTPRPVPVSRLRYRIQNLRKTIHHEVYERIEFHRQNLKQRTLREKIGYLRKRLGGTRHESDGSQSESQDLPDGLPHVDEARARVHDANHFALALYTPQSYPGRIALFVAREGKPDTFTDPNLGWDGWVAGVEKYEVPGDHDSMVREPHVRELAAKLNDCLDRAQGTQATLATMLMCVSESPHVLLRLLQAVVAI